MEYLNVYDSNKKKLNKKIVRGESLPDGEHILVTVIFIKNSDGKYLMQKTSKEKVFNTWKEGVKMERRLENKEGNESKGERIWHRKKPLKS